MTMIISVFIHQIKDFRSKTFGQLSKILRFILQIQKLCVILETGSCGTWQSDTTSKLVKIELKHETTFKAKIHKLCFR